MTFLQDKANDPLFSLATLRLGEIHWYVLKAAILMDAKRRRELERNGMFVKYELTDFGKEVGQDEINWWVFKKETDINELRERTVCVLEAVQGLKQASVHLKRCNPESYDDLLSTLRKFAEHHSGEIDLLYEYVRWLEERDLLAPMVLFTFRVWGSTRMSDRWVKLDPKKFDTPEAATLRMTAEIVLGVSSGGRYTFDRAYTNVREDILSSIDPEDLPVRGCLDIPTASVLVRAARQTYDECATYFTHVRDSLRNILLDIDKFVEQRDLMHSDAFWRKFIPKAVQMRISEAQLWDFKETLTMWHAKQQSAKGQARVTFALDVASLANARGGVLIVGVTDQNREIVGLGDDTREIENRLKFAREVIANHVEYQRDLVSFRQVIVPAKSEEKVCLVIVVAQACGVVGVRDGQGRYMYPVRRETGIERASRLNLSIAKLNLKSDNHDFMQELNQFVLDN